MPTKQQQPILGDPPAPGQEPTGPEVDAEIEALHGVETPVELPTVGRIVHFRIDLDYDPDAEPVFRPAVVIVPPRPDGACQLLVLLAPGDYPLPNAAGVKYVGETTGNVFAPYGDGTGCWRWPERLEESETFLA